MKFIPGWFVRTALIVFVVGGVVAVLVARVGVTPDRGPLSAPCWARVDSSERYGAANGQQFLDPSDKPRFFDADDGCLFHVDFPKDDVVTNPSCSPWRDEQGGHQVVAGWRSARGGGLDPTLFESGLARYTFPDGRVLDRVACDAVLTAPPCWYPGRAARILYAAGDGALYHFAFEDEAGVALPRESRPSPRRLAWRCPPPARNQTLMRDPVWPREPKLGCRLLATLSYAVRSAGRLRHQGWQIWWLLLSADGASVEDAARLTVPDDAKDTTRPAHEGHANVASGPCGLVAAFLKITDVEAGCQLRVAPVEIDPRTEAPRVRLSDSVIVAENRMATRPEFSADGRWIICARREADPRLPADRFSVEEALRRARRPPSEHEITDGNSDERTGGSVNLGNSRRR